MIKEQIPLTMAEVVDLAGATEKEQGVKSFIKQFIKMPLETALKMKEEIKKLDLIKLKDEHIVKIIDFMPEDASDLTKVISGVSLNQDEITKILDIVKKY
jgi:DNA-directed RNA polymerase subunit F